ncbi:MAG: hypothetical protein Kow0077_13260 [Anaerolineae bacterium]
MLATDTLKTQRSEGIRRVNLTRDLRPIADLIEVCFGPRLDAGGRATIRELRALSRLGPLLHVMALGDRMLRGIGQGFVWEVNGAIVGNVTLFPADYPADLGRVIAVANVAVAPEYRRRGIARRLMEASLEAIRAGGGTAAILQVDADNSGAQRLYESLGFRVERHFSTWYRGHSLLPPPRPLHSPRIDPRPAALWQAEYALAQRLFPPEKGGFGWQRPLHPREFRSSLAGELLGLLSGTSTERWIVREGETLRAALWARTRLASGSVQLTLLFPPEAHPTIAEPLLNHAVHRLTGSYRPLTCEHPADDTATSRLLERYQFRCRRTLTHMRLDL